MLEGLQKPKPNNPGCKIMKVAANLSDADAKLLLEYVMDETWVAEQLVKALAERGINFGPMAVRNHRRGICMCRKVT